METLTPEEVTSAIDFVYFGRNDNYHADYLERTNACLNYNLRSIHQAGLIGKVRLLFVDWASEQPLAEKLVIKDIYSDNIKFLYLDSTFLGQYNFDIEKINPSFAGNIGLYKSNADYCFYGASDLIATPQSFQHLYRATQELSGHEDTKLWMAERAFLSRDFFTKPRSFEDVDYYLRNFYFQSEPISGAGSGAALIGAKRTRLIEWGGLNEACSGWGGNDIELFIRATKYESFINLSKRYGVYFHKFPYSDRGMRSRSISNPPMEWTRYIDNLSNNNYNFLSPEKLSLQNPNVLDSLPSFPVFKNSNNKSSSTWQFYKIVFVSLKLYLEFFQLISAKQVLETNFPDAIVFSGAFSHRFFRVACFVCRTAVLVWRYPDDSGGHVFEALQNSRYFLRAAKIQDYFRGNIFAILEKHKFYLSSETLDFLKGKQVIVFSKVDNQIYSNISDGSFLGSLQGEWQFPNEDSKKLKIVREPLLLLVFFVMVSKKLLLKILP